VVNTDALNALSAKNRAALLGSVDEAIAFYVANYENNTTGKYEKAVTAAGLTRVTFTPQQTAELNDLAASVRDDWVKKYASEFDAKALFDFTAAQFSQ
jgi:TRAP-type C4-dicarboxylate transport system substrate-binding protein